ncbi:MAG: CBS domain-containing protein [Deltaproteobacteria bacterium]
MAAKAHTVGDIMTRRITSVAPETVRAEIVAAIQQFHVGALPVVDHGHLLGVISKGDLLVRTGQTARELMTPVIHSVPPYLPARAAAQRMLAMRVHRLFVVEDGVPVGIVTATDFLRELLDIDESPAEVTGRNRAL